jgi:ankyrin repeat protein
VFIEKPKPNLLTVAIQKGDAKRAAELINKGADVNLPDSEGYQPLAMACLFGAFETALLLIEKGCDPNAKTKGKQWSIPLVYATMCNREPAAPTSVDVAKALLAKGAAIDGTDSEGRTALMFAANRGKPKLVKFLLEKGAKINLQDDRTRSGHTALMLSNDVASTKLLLEHGADVGLRNVFGKTALEMALEDKDDPDSRAIAKVLQQSAAKK